MESENQKIKTFRKQRNLSGLYEGILYVDSLEVEFPKNPVFEFGIYIPYTTKETRSYNFMLYFLCFGRSSKGQSVHKDAFLYR